jgi:hypothetical protein
MGSKLAGVTATVPARAAHAFSAHPTRSERLTFAFGPCSEPLHAPSRVVAPPIISTSINVLDESTRRLSLAAGVAEGIPV